MQKAVGHPTYRNVPTYYNFMTTHPSFISILASGLHICIVEINLDKKEYIYIPIFTISCEELPYKIDNCGISERELFE